MASGARNPVTRELPSRRVPRTSPTPSTCPWTKWPQGASEGPSLDLVALDEALDKLAGQDPRKAKVVEQRFFAGIEMSQIAENLGVSISTVKRDWEYARMWLMREIQKGE